ncbi:MAG: Gldg family protein, partial [Chthoniobacteraceae bacterium]
QLIAFKGEQLFTNALIELTEAKQNKAYIVTGHGEYDFNAQQNKIIKEQLSRQNIKVEGLLLANLEKVPDDASALVILGTRFDFSERDLKLLTEYWDRKGRIFIALGPQGKKPGLDAWLAARGVQPTGDTVLRVVNLGGITGMMELEGLILPRSPITKSLEGVGIALIGQTQSLKLDRMKEQAAQLQLTELMTAPEGFWGETEYTGDRRTVPFFDPKKDNAAPLTLAASVEKGASRDPNVKLETARMVIVGNGDFVSVQGLQAGPAGLDLATNALNWLLNRESLIAIPPKPKQNVQISLSETQLLEIAKWVSLYIPLIIALFGLYYLWARNGKSVLKLTMTVAFSFVVCWGVWRGLLRYLGTPDGKHVSKESLIFVGAVFVIGTVAFVLQKSLRRKPQSQAN